MELKRREVSSREQEECRDVLAFEQPSAAQKFSAKISESRLVRLKKNETSLPTTRACSKVSTSEASDKTQQEREKEYELRLRTPAS